jgi:hypothetical protein
MDVFVLQRPPEAFSRHHKFRRRRGDEGEELALQSSELTLKERTSANKTSGVVSILSLTAAFRLTLTVTAKA